MPRTRVTLPSGPGSTAPTSETSLGGTTHPRLLPWGKRGVGGGALAPLQSTATRPPGSHRPTPWEVWNAVAWSCVPGSWCCNAPGD